MHRRNPTTPTRPPRSSSDSNYLPSHYQTPTKPRTPGQNNAGFGSPMIACSNHNITSLRDSKNSKQSQRFLAGLIFIAVLVFMRAVNSVNSFSTLQMELSEAQDNQFRNAKALDYAKETSVDLEQRAAVLERENREMKRRLNEQILQKEEEMKTAQILQKREGAIKRQVDYLKGQIQEVSRREALERFGPGPHIVEFDVIFSGAEADEEPSKFAVEMAPLDLMPHSVLLFLEMVEKQLWDETAFVHHTHHIVSATPTIYHTGISKRSEFDKEGLAHVAFQEYTEEYPHDVYTLGFSGRPGGPDFYISTMDNSQMHGPGGQMDAELIEEADPCFAKVIRGFDIVDRIYQKGVVAPLDIHVVGIVSAAITER